MQWKNPTVPDWLAASIGYPVAAIGLVVFSPLLLTLWVDDVWSRRQRAKGRHVWFAWRPVYFDGFWYEDQPSRWFWLERIERRRDHRGWQYWPLGFVDPYEERRR